MPGSEFSHKQEQIRDHLEARELDALLLQRVSSFAWATCGAASYVNTATTNGESSLLITPSDRYLLTNNIEATRLEQEEQLKKQGWTFLVAPWHQSQDALADLTRGLRLGADGPYPGAVDLSGEMARLRANLTPGEIERFRLLGRLCAEAMDSAIRAVRPGQSEYEIAGLLAQESESRGAQAIVNLIATDQRIFSFRHPLPTDKELDTYALLVLCGRRWGLICSITRLIPLRPSAGRAAPQVRGSGRDRRDVHRRHPSRAHAGGDLPARPGRLRRDGLPRGVASPPPGWPGGLRGPGVHRHTGLHRDRLPGAGLRLESIHHRSEVGGHHPRGPAWQRSTHRHRRLALPDGHRGW